MEPRPSKFKSVAKSIGGALVTGPLSYFFGTVAESWGILDPAAKALGGWLKTTVSPEAAALGAATMIFAFLYGLFLWRVWRPYSVVLATSNPPSWQAELDRENRTAIQKSRREAIADCRKMIAEWGDNHSHYDQRAAMEASPSFLLLGSHFSQHFRDYLARNMLGTIDPSRHHRPMAMAALAAQLDRLEKEWGLT